MTDYGASLGFGLALSFTPTGGAQVNCDAVQELTPPPEQNSVVTWVPLDGSLAGKEQPVKGKEDAVDASAKLTYTPARYVALRAARGLAGTFELVTNDGLILSAPGILYKVNLGQIASGAIQTIDIAFKIAGGGFSVTAGTVVTAMVPLVAGAATIDLTAAPWSGNGKSVKAIAFLADPLNANPLTVAKGAASGYGSAFSHTLAAGDQMNVYPAAADAAIGAANKTIDLSGTGTQDVEVSVLMV